MNYTIKNQYLTIEISSLGAEIQSIKKDNLEYLWQGDLNSWKNRATNIFPYIGRLTEGKYTFKGKTYTLGNHGFARATEFLAEKIDENKIVFKTSYNEDTLKDFPFKFDFFITYEIIENTLKIGYQVLNIDEKTMYFAVGGHPGFNIPLEIGLNFEDYYLEFSKDCIPINNIVSKTGQILKKVEYPLLENKILKLNHSIFDNDALIFENIPKQVFLKSKNGDKKIRVFFPNMNYLGIWHSPKKEVNFICIEPWTSLPSREGIIEDFEKQENLISLNSFQKYENYWGIEIF